MRQVENDYIPGIPSAPGVNAEFMAVLVNGAQGGLAPRFSCYVGMVPKGTATDQRKRKAMAEWVASMGTKQSYSDALRYFPQVQVENYNG